MEKDGSNTRNELRWLLAELTYACPLQCPYCSNPVDFALRKGELTTDEWKKVFDDARAMGAVQLGFSGGEPLVRQDLEQLVEHAKNLGYYTNLITSSVGMTTQRIHQLKEAGLDTVQISIQSSDKPLNDYLAGTDSYQHKLDMAREVKKAGYPLILNFVLHRHNIERVADILNLAVTLQANYVELANTQYYGFALHNRNKLLPTEAQVKCAESITQEYQKKYSDSMKIYYVVPDYYSDRPKPCMNGWGSVFMTITPDGYALPCHNARSLPNLSFPSVKDHAIDWIWKDSPLFNHFRGESWMKMPCQTCPERKKDFGGCRCQAYDLTGDMYAADPVCSLSPDHEVIVNAIKEAAATKAELNELTYRNPKNSKRISTK